jgi:hypothetical protein
MFNEAILRAAPWSISKAGTLERCQRQYLFKYLNRTPEGPSPKTGRVGTAVHYVLENGLRDDNDDPLVLEAHLFKIGTEIKLLQKDIEEATLFLPACADFIQRIRKFKLKFGVKEIMVEQKIGIDMNFQKTNFFDNHASLLRGVIDLALITNDDFLLCFDHKTGKVKPVTWHYPQIYSYALMCAANFPIKNFQGVIHYVGNPDLQRLSNMSMDHIQTILRPWLETYLNNLTDKVVMIDRREDIPTTGWQCEWCTYVYEPGCSEGQVTVAKKGHKYSPKKLPNI